MPVLSRTWSDSFTDTALITGGYEDVSDYERYIEILDTDGLTVLAVLGDNTSDSVLVSDVSFELLKYGGCGSGSLTIDRSFAGARDIDVGMHVRISYKPGDPWYYGRIEEVDYTTTNSLTIRTYGLYTYMSDLTTGGMAWWSSDDRPHLFAGNDQFDADPDWSYQTWDTCTQYEEFLSLLYEIHVEPNMPLVLLGSIDNPRIVTTSSDIGQEDRVFQFQSMKFRGEETLSQIIRSVAVMMGNYAFGVDEQRRFFCIAPRNKTIIEFQEGVNCQNVSMKRDRSMVYTRILLTGDYVYGTPDQAGFYRYRAIIRNQAAATLYGDKKINVCLPWVRTAAQAVDFAYAFFRKYSAPTTRVTFTTTGQSGLIKPWLCTVRIRDSDGTILTTSEVSSMNVRFNAVPTFDMTIGPEDVQFPEPPEPQRWEIGQDLFNLSVIPALPPGSSST